MQEIPGQQFLNEVIISDDCHIDFPIALNTTGIENSFENSLPVLSNVRLSLNGETGFTLSENQELQIALYDVSGRIVSSIPSQKFGAGSHFIDFNKLLIEGMYLLQAVTPDGRRATYKLHTK